MIIFQNHPFVFKEIFFSSLMFSIKHSDFAFHIKIASINMLFIKHIKDATPFFLKIVLSI
jgi:hypothetical protein